MLYSFLQAGGSAESVERRIRCDMKYNLLDSFQRVGSYDGTPGTDAVGNYIVFPAECRDIITAGSWIEDPDGNMFQIKQDDSIVINDVRHLKLYY